MSDKENDLEAISIGPSLLSSGDFEKLYSEGMRLIEEVATYLDNAGRKESRELNREAAFVYSSESMRLTTRLMQMASWLLLQRAVAEGEITSKNAAAEKQNVKFSPTPSDRGGPGWDELPKSLVEYIKKSDRLYERVIRLDRLEKDNIDDMAKKAKGVTQSDGGIADQLSRLQAAFSKE